VEGAQVTVRFTVARAVAAWSAAPMITIDDRRSR